MLASRVDRVLIDPYVAPNFVINARADWHLFINR